MEDRDHFEAVVNQPVPDPVVTYDYFANSVNVELRDLSADSRIVGKSLMAVDFERTRRAAGCSQVCEMALRDSAPRARYELSIVPLLLSASAISVTKRPASRSARPRSMAARSAGSVVGQEARVRTSARSTEACPRLFFREPRRTPNFSLAVMRSV